MTLVALDTLIVLVQLVTLVTLLAIVPLVKHDTLVELITSANPMKIFSLREGTSYTGLAS